MDFALNLPLNKVSFGQCSINILREMHKRGLEPALFPIGDVDVKAYSISEDFQKWLEVCANKSYVSHSRKNPTFRLWHIANSLESLSENQVLFTFHETDQPTKAELNIVKNNKRVFFSSEYSKHIFSELGCENVRHLPLGFDKYSFSVLDKKYGTPGQITFGLAGKLEKRKQHTRVLRLWARKFGNNPKYFLNLALYNQFLPPELQHNMIIEALEGKNYFNIGRLPFMDENKAYNDYLNSNSIMIGMSSAEGWGLPEFQSVAIGKHAVILNATGYKEWATDENVVLVSPDGKVPLYDNIFFKEGMPFNQGQGYDWSDEAFYEGIDRAIARFENNPVNQAGLKLADKFTWANTVDKIIEEIEKIN